MRRNDIHNLLSGCLHAAGSVRSMVVLAFLFAIFPFSLFAQRAASSYEVLSATPEEVVVRIAPTYSYDTVSTDNGPAVRIRFAQGSFAHSIGAPGEMKLSLAVLLPSAVAPKIEVLSEQYNTYTGLALAPVPTHEKHGDIFIERYTQDASLYASSPVLPANGFALTGIARTAYSGNLNIYPVRSEGGAIKLIKELVLRLTFTPSSKQTDVTSSARESEFFTTTFINGTVRAFQRSAANAIARTAKISPIGFKQSPAAGEEKWVAIKTTEEGIYRITADQLSQYGISNPDPATIAVYGFGAKMVPEGIDSMTGEMAEVAIDMRTSGGAFKELRFYAPGMYDWRYSPEATPAFSGDKYWQIYHMTNPYSSTGHFMLRVGGAQATRRIVDKADHLTKPATPLTSLPAIALHENELNFEFPNYSREFVGESITRGTDVTVSLPALPGYTSGATSIRPATNSRAEQSHSFEFRINGSVLGTCVGRTLADIDESPYYSLRNWDVAFPWQGSAPSTLTINVTSNEKQPQYWLDFVEIFYQREAKLSNGALAFFLANDSASYQVTIADAATAELWDITDARKNFRLATASGASLSADLEAPGKAMRRFYAFREGDVRSPELSSANAPILRPGICQNGTEMIVIVPEAYKEQGERLAVQRRRGGQATEPIGAEVVTVEDIYREFGYGAKDLTAIRDFLAYTLRHTVANGNTVPLFVSLFGKGHTDYQNRKTQMPIGVPAYETTEFGSLIVYRQRHPEFVPDDAFFARLVSREPSASDILDIAPGRIAVRDADEAKTFVDKVIRYETASDEGSWRARSVFIADDRYYELGTDSNDPLPHMPDSENEIAGMDKRMSIEKLYGVSFPNTFSSSGARFKPEFEAAIVDAFNVGSALISFVGHGNPNVWTHESVLKVPATINKLTNLNKLTFLTTATCDFTAFDNFDELSGGVMLLLKSDGGIIGSLGTSRSVYGGEQLVAEFYQKLFDVSCSATRPTAPVGLAYLAGRKVGDISNKGKFFILGDPSQRLLIPRQYVIIDSVNGIAYDEDATQPARLKALSQVTLSGYISSSCDGSEFDPQFNGTTTITLRDAPTVISQTTTFTKQPSITDTWSVEGPILYRGTATVKDGRFSVKFIVPKDIKFDTVDAKLQMLAYSTDFRSALGAARNLQVFGIDTSHIVDTEGPALTIFIGNRRFTPGDVVPVHSKIIVDIADSSGLNTSTSSIGHSFAGWVNDQTSSVIDLSESYVSRQDDYKAGTAERQATLPLGKNVLHVRAFDALNNPSEATVEFIAREGDPYELFDVALTDNPVRTGTTFSFLQPSSPQNPVDVTIGIYTSDGRKMRTLSASGVTTNDVQIHWDVRDDAGMLVPDAAYIYGINIEDRLTGEVAHAGGVFIVQKQ